MTALAMKQPDEEEATQCKCYYRAMTPGCCNSPSGLTITEVILEAGIFIVSLEDTKRKE